MMLGIVALVIGLLLITAWLYRVRKASPAPSTPRPMDWREIVAISVAFALVILIGIIVSRAFFMI